MGRLAADPERAEWLQWLHFAETVAVDAASLVQQHLVIADEQLRSPTVQKLERMRLEKRLELLDQHLEGRSYLLVSGFSAVDTAVGYSVPFGQHFTDIKLFSNVAAYYQHLTQRPTFIQPCSLLMISI